MPLPENDVEEIDELLARIDCLEKDLKAAILIILSIGGVLYAAGKKG